MKETESQTPSPSSSKQFWETALRFWRDAEDLLKDKKFQESADAATTAVLLGIRATNTLSKELKMPDLNVIAGNVLSDWQEREFGGKYHTPKETIEWSLKTLKRLYDDFPPNTLCPFR